MLLHSGERPYVCDYIGCMKSFTRTDELKRHKLTHTGNYLSKKIFSGTISFFVLGEKNFVCAYCDKKFLRKDHALKHLQVHMVERKATLTVNGPID